LLLVHDGSDFLQYADLAGCIDRLIDAGAIAPMALVLLDPWDRIAEYGANPAYSRHAIEEVLPHVSRRLRLRPSSVASLGSSLGAVAALAIAWHHPQSLAGLALLSGSFAHRIEDQRASHVFGPIVEFLAEFETDPRLDGVAVYQSAGRYERLSDLNRRLAPILGYWAPRHTYQETWDGHHWESWRDRIGDALTFLFPGPGSLVRSDSLVPEGPLVPAGSALSSGAWANRNG
jgi:enterochelin esterase family protein